jgi:sigma54-dependent transcription regulator
MEPENLISQRPFYEERERLKKDTSNDADRLRKYLARFGLKWESVQQP